MTYAQALAYIAASGRFGIKLGLERVRALLDAMGSPDAGIRGVLVGGTNGKGSTCAYLVSILTAAGYRVGSMPKPHLRSYTERICIDGRPISEARFARLISQVRPVVDGVAREHGAATEFEILTAAAVKYLRDAEIDWLVCEVGLGGALDATNVLDLGVKVITSVDLDHQQYLGPDIAAIAKQKAGIIRSGDIVLTGALHPEAAAVVEREARTVGAEIWKLGTNLKLEVVQSGWRGQRFCVQAPCDPTPMRDLETRMIGRHQARNAALAVASVCAMQERWEAPAGRGHIREGLRKAKWPGRMELVHGRPRILIDSAHNPAAVARVVGEVEALGVENAVVLFGAMSDKDINSMLRLIPAGWPAVHTAVAEERAEPASDLLARAQALGREGDVAHPAVADALKVAQRQAGPRGLVLVLGSLYLAGAVRDALRLP